MAKIVCLFLTGVVNDADILGRGGLLLLVLLCGRLLLGVGPLGGAAGHLLPLGLVLPGAVLALEGKTFKVLIYTYSRANYPQS